MQCDALIPTLLDALFLDPEHPRKDMDEALRAGIQRDGAECFLQLALYEPGKQLLEQHPEALDALRALVDGAALTEEARLSASAALAAVEGLAPGAAPAPGDEKHVMMSCAFLSQPSCSARIDDRVVFRPMGRASDHPALGRVAAKAWLRGLVRCGTPPASLPHVSVLTRVVCRPGAHEGISGRCVSAQLSDSSCLAVFLSDC